jgi:hypothetical protein
MSVAFVSATRLLEAQFRQRSPLWRSLQSVRQAAPVALRVFASNARPLGACYNEAIEAAAPDDVIVFVHDDVWIDDWMAGWRVQEALGRFDVVGVAGNTRRQPRQETWYARPGGEQVDTGYLSGAIAHGPPGQATLNLYGPSPADVRLVDGVFIAARASRLRQAGVRFDPAFPFHFYDMDFCRSAERAGLRIGTWPIAITHASEGAGIGTPSWMAACAAYFAKWPEPDAPAVSA